MAFFNGSHVYEPLKLGLTLLNVASEATIPPCERDYLTGLTPLEVLSRKNSRNFFLKSA